MLKSENAIIKFCECAHLSLLLRKSSYGSCICVVKKSPENDGTGVVLVALDLDKRDVDVLAVADVDDESFLELEKFESCDVFRAISQEECRRRLSSIRNGMEQ